MDRGRGRARGRARDPTTQGGPRPGPAQGQRPAGAWGAPRGGPPGLGGPPVGGIPSVQQPPMQAQGAWGPRPGQPPMRGPTPAVPSSSSAGPGPGRASYRGAGDGPGPSAPIAGPTGQVSGAGDAGDASHSGRGAHRGRRAIGEPVVRTKPENCATKKGTSGTPCRLMANYFQVLQKPDWCLYQYRVDFAPEEDLTHVRKSYFRVAVKSLELGGYIFDGTVMYTAKRLNQDTAEVFAPSKTEGGQPVRVSIRLVSEINAGDHHYIQIFNIIIRNCMSHLNLQLIRRDFFDPVAKIPIPQYNLDIWPGYKTSIRQHENSILMCGEITHKYMRNDTVLNLLEECYGEDRANWKDLFRSRIIGAIVLTDYNNKTYRVDDIDFDSSPMSTFGKKDGSVITFKQYFQERYGVTLRNRDQPMIINNAKAREIRAGQPDQIRLPPEVCRMTGLTENQRSNFQLMRALSDYTRVGPPQRIEKLINFCKRLTGQPKSMAELMQWDSKIAPKIIEFAGRVLPMEKLIGGGPPDRAQYPAGKDVDWTRELRSRKMFQDVPIKYWVAICPTRLRQSANKFMQMLCRAAQGMSWGLAEPRFLDIPDDRVGTYLQAMDSVLREGANPTMILCVVMNNKADRYAALKKKCCVDNAIPSQVVVARNLDSKGSMSIATKMAIQMNCKVGGAPWTVNIPLSNVMVVGYDVCHDPSNKSKSYGALVASLNKQLTRYYSSATAHTNGEELSNHLGVEMIKALQSYKKNRDVLPDRIIIYRDGVGDGQLTYVYEHEIMNLRKVLTQFYGAQTYKMAFIVVSKRINTRIFTADKRNPDPGTCVDDVITLPERYDFFIVSQCTRQGTVSPTSYNVLFDDFGLPADKLHIFTYKLTHMYFNWSGTVRVPAPCQYAHKLAFLVAQSLHRSPHPGLSDLLYYL